VDGWNGPHQVGFAHTVLVDVRERLRCSDRPERVFAEALTRARQADTAKPVTDCDDVASQDALVKSPTG
jgi:hypothetical protein